METISGYAIKKKGMGGWSVLCEEWILLTERYSRISYEGDTSYGFNERANVGVLAGAAWRCGKIALEEYQSEKNKNDEVVNGRTDLWICDEDNNEEIIEAKFKWLNMNSKKLIEMVKETTEKSYEDAVNSSVETGVKAVGVSFFPLWVKNPDESEINEAIYKTIKRLKESEINTDILAWCFPKEDRVYTHENGNVTPGVIMVGQLVKNT